MNLKNLVDKQVVMQFKFGLMLCGYDAKNRGISPGIVASKDGQGQQLIQVPFAIGMLRQDPGSESFWIEIDDPATGALIRTDVADDMIASVSSIAKEPSRLVM